MYGVTAFPGFRLYDVRVAEAITYLGRQLLGSAKKIAEDAGYYVCYGDTDSTFVVLGEGSLESKIKEAQNLSSSMNKIMSQQIKEQTNRTPLVEMEFEKLQSLGVIHTVSDLYNVLDKDQMEKYYHPKTGLVLPETSSGEAIFFD